MPRQYPPAITDAIYKLQQEIGAVQTWNDAVWINNNFVKVVYKHLGPYLLPPSQHLKDNEAEFIMLPRNLWQPVAIDKDLGLPRHPKLGDEVVYYIKKKGDVGMTYCPFRDEYVDTPEHCVKEDNEPLPESKSKNILQNGQPKVDWSEGDDIQYYRHDGYGGGRRIPGKLKQWVKAIIHAGDIHGIVNFGEIRKPVFEEELKQSTPKIEKINIAYMEGCGEQTVWEEPIIVKKINEVIDYINNKDLLTKL